MYPAETPGTRQTGHRETPPESAPGCPSPVTGTHVRLPRLCQEPATDPRGYRPGGGCRETIYCPILIHRMGRQPSQLSGGDLSRPDVPHPWAFRLGPNERKPCAVRRPGRHRRITRSADAAKISAVPSRHIHGAFAVAVRIEGDPRSIRRRANVIVNAPSFTIVVTSRTEPSPSIEALRRGSVPSGVEEHGTRSAIKRR